MCGIAGIFHFKSSLKKNSVRDIEKFVGHLSSRGPDGQGIWQSDNKRLFLGHTRLSIIDVSHNADQPMVSMNERYVIVFNGEIYNYRFLREELIKSGCKFKTNSDTEVLLHLYDIKKEKMVNLLQGMFAFAIWDKKERKLFLARDHFGIKPLYYSFGNGTFYFASQVKTLLQSEDISAEVSSAGQVGFFLWGSVPEPWTFYEKIKSFPPGQTLIMQEGKAPVWQKYFNFVQDYNNEHESSKTAANVQEAKEKLRQVLYSSVQSHLVSDVPVGVFLSAGRDSTVIASLAKELSSTKLESYTLGFHEFANTEKDEVRLATFFAKKMALNSNIGYIKQDDFDAEYNRLLTAMDQPSIDGVNTYFVSRLVASCGCKVALSGLGADELFGGYANFNQIPKIVRYFKLISNIPMLGKSTRMALTALLGKVAPKHIGLFEYGGNFPGAYFLKRGLFMPWELDGVLPDDIIKQGLDELETFNCLKASCEGMPDDFSKVQALEMQWYMKNQLLRDSDWAGMANSLEIRVPFVDINLFKIIARYSKLIHFNKEDMSAAPNFTLPNEILNRKKTGFNIPVSQWTRNKNIKFKGLKSWAVTLNKKFTGEV